MVKNFLNNILMENLTNKKNTQKSQILYRNLEYGYKTR